MAYIRTCVQNLGAIRRPVLTDEAMLRSESTHGSRCRGPGTKSVTLNIRTYIRGDPPAGSKNLPFLV